MSVKAVVERSSAHVIYDPFEVLGLTAGASEKNVKRAYKIMSLKWHPDKAKGEAARVIANARFVEINKAYKT